MIFSRFGSEFKPEAKDAKWPEVPWLWGRYAREKTEEPEEHGRWVNLADLKAEGGWQEIETAAASLPIREFEEPKSGAEKVMARTRRG